jgi:hypothetical protein
MVGYQMGVVPVFRQSPNSLRKSQGFRLDSSNILWSGTEEWRNTDEYTIQKNPYYAENSPLGETRRIAENCRRTRWTEIECAGLQV